MSEHLDAEPLTPSGAASADPEPESTPDPAGADVATAERALADGQFERAVAALTVALRREPNRADLLARRGAAHLAADQLDEAANDLTAALALAPDNPEWLCLRGEARLRSGNLGFALYNFDKASRLAPDRADAFRGLGLTYLAGRALDEALAAFDRLVELCPESGDAFAQRARCHLAAFRTEEAEADVVRAIELDPTGADPRRLAVEVALRAARLDDAAARIDDLNRLLPGHAVVHYLRGKLEYRHGRHESALRELDAAVRLDPGYADAAGARGGVYRALGRHTEALDDLAAAVLGEPKYAAEYLVQRGIVSGDRGEYDRAAADLIAALAIEPGNRAALRTWERVRNQQLGAAALAVGGSGVLQYGSADAAPARRAAAPSEVPAGSASEADFEIDLEDVPDWPAAPSEGAPTAAETTPTAADTVAADTDPGIEFGADDEVLLADAAPPASAAAPTGKLPRTPAPAAPAPAPVVRHPDPAPTPAPVRPAPRPAPAPPRPAATRSASEDSDEKRGYVKWVFVGLLVLAVGMIATGYFVESSGSAPAAPDAPFVPAHTLTADDYWAQFSKDNAAANRKFEGMNIEISGKVARVLPDQRGFVLSAGAGAPGVECQFPRGARIESVRVGDQIVVQGEGLFRPNRTGSAFVGNCRLKN